MKSYQTCSRETDIDIEEVMKKTILEVGNSSCEEVEDNRHFSSSLPWCSRSRIAQCRSKGGVSAPTPHVRVPWLPNHSQGCWNWIIRLYHNSAGYMQDGCPPSHRAVQLLDQSQNAKSEGELRVSARNRYHNCQYPAQHRSKGILTIVTGRCTLSSAFHVPSYAKSRLRRPESHIS